jgi:hypothetical protein
LVGIKFYLERPIQAKINENYNLNTGISAAEIKIGTIKSDMIRYNAGAMGIVVGTNGGTVNGGGGAEG